MPKPPSRLDVFPTLKDRKGNTIKSLVEDPQIPSEELYQDVTSSLPLPSPGEMLRSLLRPGLPKGGIGNIMKGFRTARELLQQERQKDNRLSGGSRQRGKQYDIPPPQKQLKAKNAQGGGQKPLTRTATVSSHFSKRKKTTSVTSRSKAVSLDVQTRPILGAGAPQPQSEQCQKQILVINENDDPIQPAPVTRLDWTAVKKSISLVEIPPAQFPKKKTSGGTIADLVYNPNITPALRTGPAPALIGSISPTCDATKHSLQVLKKPSPFFAFSTLTTSVKSDTKKDSKKFRRKIQNVPESPNVVVSKSPTIRDLLLEQTGISSSTVTKIQTTKIRHRKKTEIASKPKPKGKQKRVKKTVKEDTEETIELLSPKSAIRRANQQQMVFGNLSQLANQADHMNSPNLRKFTCSETRGMPLFGDLKNASIIRKSEDLYDEEFEALEEFLHDELGSGARAVKKDMKAKGLWDAAARNDGLANYLFEESWTLLGPDIQLFQPQIKAGEECQGRNSRLAEVTSSGVAGLIPSRVVSNTPVKPPTQFLISPNSHKRVCVESPPTDSTPFSSTEERNSELVSLSPRKRQNRMKAKTHKQLVKASIDGDSKRPAKSRSEIKTPSRKRTVSLSSPNNLRKHTPLPQPSKGRTLGIAIHRYISKAILAEYTAEVDISKTWHYRILLYQPIILEDLTEWLNTIGLKKVGVSCEVSPPEVREWADERSVLCIWKLNHRGKKRKMI